MRLSRGVLHLSCARPAAVRNGHRVAIVGAGPAGLYTADELLRSAVPPAHVDMFERRPLPYGLVRYGVAPDHPEVKLVCGRFSAEVLDDPAVTLYGMVEVGSEPNSDVTLAALRQHYDAVFLCHGAYRSKPLVLPVHGHTSSTPPFAAVTAQQVVGWYNGELHEAHRRLGLEGVRDVVIVGAGNVAIDIARILLLDPATLATTDIARHALLELQSSAIRTVTIIARRDALHAAFTTQELRELTRCSPGLALKVHPRHVTLSAPGQEAFIAQHRPLRRFHQLLSSIAERPPAPDAKRALAFEFCHSPTSVVLRQDGNGIQSLCTHPTTVQYADDGSSRVLVDAGREERFPCDLLVSAIGYDAGTIDATLAPLSARANHVAHTKGRIAPGLYVCGWAKRGPQGIVATNKWDAAETVATYLADALPCSGTKAGFHPVPKQHTTILRWPQMERIEVAERARANGKFTSWEEMSRALESRQ